MAVAVKKISRGSKQGKKEYINEVKIISSLRHRNLVQLIGWCHVGGEFLLAYEYMPKGSLDSHLFGRTRPLTWSVGNKISFGLASAVLYLHEEWEQCVIQWERGYGCAESEPEMSLVEWVWDLYGSGLLAMAIDERVNQDCNQEQANCLMIVGLRCAHPDRNLKHPSSRRFTS
ncbi:hypothetical protein CDL15_Pgr013397 [Punica granatum]|uniref:Protein kinase domain-containing protein n=1 Tax=Punica granatum TaxID=22663 RepID=A0A218W1J5_PUNGR|nr:hypothetical protein CDL15_Pgr013397 [Punica granatum]